MSNTSLIAISLLLNFYLPLGGRQVRFGLATETSPYGSGDVCFCGMCDVLLKKMRRPRADRGKRKMLKKFPDRSNSREEKV